MQPKKNPKADLNQNRNLYFVIGLSLVLGITWGAIEYKSYEKAFDLSNIDMLEDDEEDIPITEQSPRTRKQAVTGSGSSQKDQVAKMVMRLLGINEQPQEDAADALAIAICHYHQLSLPEPLRSPNI